MTSRYPSRSLTPPPDPGYLSSLPALALTPGTPQVHLFCGMNLGTSRFTCTATDPGHPAAICHQISQTRLFCLLRFKAHILEEAGTESGQTYEMNCGPVLVPGCSGEGFLTRCSVHSGVQSAKSHRGEVCKDALPGGAIKSLQKCAVGPCG